MKSPQSAGLAVKQGFKKVYCYLDGFPAWQKAGYPVESIKDFLPAVQIPLVTPAELKALLDGDKAAVVDVRDIENRAGGHIKGELNIPLENLMADHTKIPKVNAVVVVDLHGTQGGSPAATWSSRASRRSAGSRAASRRGSPPACPWRSRLRVSFLPTRRPQAHTLRVASAAGGRAN